MAQVDFQSLARDLLANAESHLREWFPEGKVNGHHYCIGNLSGEKGESLKINLQNGMWIDFATNESGGDLISLYAGKCGLSQIEAARALGANVLPAAAPRPARKPPKLSVIEAPLAPVPEDAPPPPSLSAKDGPVTRWWDYRDASGQLLGKVARYDPAGRRKVIRPWRWLGGEWHPRAFPTPRILYGLDALAAARPDKRVMLVEGEKAADALRPLLRSHVVMTWCGGASAIGVADFEPLRGRSVDLWPDADEPGIEAMRAVGTILLAMGCTVRRVDPLAGEEGKADGWDAADAAAEGWDTKRIVNWITRDDGRHLIRLTAAEPAPVRGAESPLSSPAPPTPPGAGSAPARRSSAAEREALWDRLGLDRSTSNGIPPPNEDTFLRIIQCDLPHLFYLDTFLQRVMTAWNRDAASPLTDADVAALTVMIQRDYHLHRATITRVESALNIHSERNPRNCAQAWINSIKWDGVERLDKLCPIGFGTVDDEYHRCVGKNFIMGMAARVLNPGCQVDNVPIFEGSQGIGKSTALRILGGDWFTEATDSILTKDFLQNMRGKMLIEIAELHAFRKADQDRIKGIISNRSDTYRPSYGRVAADFPRQCVFAGTTNRSDWVIDETGARRFWRVLTGAIDLEWLKANRDQLFAEAAHRVRGGEPHWIVPKERQVELTEAARDTDIWTEPVMGYAMAARRDVRIEEILSHALMLDVSKHTQQDARRVRAILRIHGWKTVTSRDAGTSSVTRAWRPDFGKAPRAEKAAPEQQEF